MLFKKYKKNEKKLLLNIYSDQKISLDKTLFILKKHDRVWSIKIIATYVKYMLFLV